MPTFRANKSIFSPYRFFPSDCCAPLQSYRTKTSGPFAFRPQCYSVFFPFVAAWPCSRSPARCPSSWTQNSSSPAPLWLRASSACTYSVWLPSSHFCACAATPYSKPGFTFASFLGSPSFSKPAHTIKAKITLTLMNLASLSCFSLASCWVFLAVSWIFFYALLCSIWSMRTRFLSRPTSVFTLNKCLRYWEVHQNLLVLNLFDFSITDVLGVDIDDTSIFVREWAVLRHFKLIVIYIGNLLHRFAFDIGFLIFHLLGGISFIILFRIHYFSIQLIFLKSIIISIFI